MTTTALELVKPQEYFRMKISHAASSLKVDIGTQLEFYLVNLLCNFIAPHQMDEGTGDVLNTPLAIMLKNALESSAETRLKLLKRLGDTSLYFAGYFQDYFNRKTFDIGYYISMGTTAYTTLATAVKDRHGDDQLTEMYRDLAEKFVNLVDIVAEVSEAPTDGKSLNILAIYERWTHTNSDRLRRILEDEGITAIPNPIRKAQ